MTELEQLEAMFRSRPASLSIEKRRVLSDSLGDRFPLALDIERQPADARGVPAEWTSTPAADQNRVILYFHGGGYVWGSLKSHRHLVSELGRAAKMRTLALHYRRAPEFPFPHALEDAVSGYKFLMDEGFDPRRIVLAGDSAGGGLSVALMLRLKELGWRQPAAALLLSPWVDMTASSGSYSRNGQLDFVLSRELIQFLAGQYLGERPRNTPLASPVFADLNGIAPLIILAGAREILLDDALALGRAAGLADVRVHLDIWPQMFHIWPVYHRMLAQGRQAIDSAGKLLLEAVSGVPDHLD